MDYSTSGTTGRSMRVSGARILDEQIGVLRVCRVTVDAFVRSNDSDKTSGTCTMNRDRVVDVCLLTSSRVDFTIGVVINFS
jgi:hypothetical protein